MINAISNVRKEDQMDLKTRIGQKFLVVSTLCKTLEVLELAGITDKSDILFQSNAGIFRVVYRREVYDGVVLCYPLDELACELSTQRGPFEKNAEFAMPHALSKMLYEDKET